MCCVLPRNSSSCSSLTLLTPATSSISLATTTTDRETVERDAAVADGFIIEDDVAYMLTTEPEDEDSQMFLMGTSTATGFPHEKKKGEIKINNSYSSYQRTLHCRGGAFMLFFVSLLYLITYQPEWLLLTRSNTTTSTTTLNETFQMYHIDEVPKFSYNSTVLSTMTTRKPWHSREEDEATGTSSSMLPTTTTSNADTSESVYVPGAGFSGFFYTLGRLKLLSNKKQQYYCFSAGCLGVVATLLELSVDDVTDMAFDVQQEWWNGNLPRYDIPKAFVERLLPVANALEESNNDKMSAVLSQINIITTGKTIESTTKDDNNQKRSWFSLMNVFNFSNVIIRRPVCFEELKQMLIQTTHIPFATGNGLYNEEHNDGGFSMLYHPPCDIHIQLPFSKISLWMNILNPSLTRQHTHTFYNMGYNHDSGSTTSNNNYDGVITGVTPL